MDKIIENELESKQKMPKEMKVETIRTILKNLLMVVIVLITLSIVCFMDEKLIKENFATGLKIISIFFVIVSIVGFEIAYRKEKFNFGMWAIEFLILGMIIMFVPYLSQYIQKIIIGVAVGFGVYYIIKLLIIVLKKRKDFLNQKSDVKDILKEEKKGYLDEVSKKKFGGKKND